MAEETRRDDTRRPGESDVPGAPTPDAHPSPADPGSTAVMPAVDDRSPLAGFAPEVRRRRWPRVLATLAGVLVVLAGGYVGALWALADVLPRGTTVAGVDIGGMGRDEAVAALGSGLAARVDEEIPVTANGRTTSVDPASAGLTFDAEATVDRLTGFDLHPARLVAHVVGNRAQSPVTEADPQALATAVEDAAGSLATEPVDAGVVFADGAPHVTPASQGSLVDQDAAADALRDGWLTAPRPLELATEAAEPDITQAEAETALATVAGPFAAAPVVVVVGGQSVELPVEVLTSLASFVPEASELALRLDGPRLVEEVLARTTDLVTPSSDARFEFVDDAPVIVPGTPGTTLDPAVLADAVVAAGTSDDRTARVELVASDPAQSTAELEALGIKEIVSEFSTPLTNEPDRTENLRVGASKVTGELVLPGEVFSLTEVLGPITAAAGFNNATVIVNGEHVPGIGGGLSQMATTTYNAAFFAGFEDVEHQPHSEWFARYPEGRESTLYTGVIDMKFRNTSPYGALMQSWVAGGRLHVRIWGTKHFTVETSTSPRSNVVRPTTVHSSSPTCTPQSAGNPGFQVTVTRRVLLGGVEQETTSDTWRYKPQNAVVCD